MRWSTFRLGFCLWFFLLAAALTGCGPGKPSTPPADKGVIDLTNWRPEADGPQMLAGLWRMRWNSLDPNVGNDQTLPLAPVPALWNLHRPAGPMLDGTGYASYGITVMLPPNRRDLALRIGTHYIAARLFANGKEIAEVGQVSANQESEIPGATGIDNRVIPLPDGGDRLDLTLQVSNHRLPIGGPIGRIMIGERRSLAEQFERELISAAILVGACLSFGTYHLILFRRRREEQSNLYFGLLTLSVAMIYGFSTGVLNLFLPVLGPEAGIRMPALFAIIAIGCYIGFMHALFDLWLPASFGRLVFLALGLLSIPVIAGDLAYSLWSFLGALAVFAICGPVWTAALAKTPARMRRPVWGAMGIYLGLALALMHDATLLLGLHRGQGLMLYAFLVTMLIWSSTIAFRYASARKGAEELAASLADLNRSLESQVVERTQHLEKAMTDLKGTQAQLVAREKMASLGQVTAGIAHEIKNPLNFINNYAEVADELLTEMKTKLAALPVPADAQKDLNAILGESAESLNKILSHGRRADNIVRAMLAHSRGDKGEPEPVDLNGLIDQTLTLAYHGEKARNPAFQVVVERHFDANAGIIVLQPQDMSRVLLNMIDNGFYALQAKQKMLGQSFKPKLEITTRDLGMAAEIIIRDNGAGMPEETRAKLFTPFFTTKPSGQGTGLGLSLSFDIVVQRHGGTIDVLSEPGEYTEFRLVLPRRPP